MNNRSASHAIIALTVMLTVMLFSAFFRATMGIATAIRNNRKSK